MEKYRGHQGRSEEYEEYLVVILMIHFHSHAYGHAYFDPI